MLHNFWDNLRTHSIMLYYILYLVEKCFHLWNHDLPPIMYIKEQAP